MATTSNRPTSSQAELLGIDEFAADSLMIEWTQDMVKLGGHPLALLSVVKGDQPGTYRAVVSTRKQASVGAIGMMLVQAGLALTKGRGVPNSSIVEQAREQAGKGRHFPTESGTDG
jgi:hypothetical protein